MFYFSLVNRHDRQAVAGCKHFFHMVEQRFQYFMNKVRIISFKFNIVKPQLFVFNEILNSNVMRLSSASKVRAPNGNES